MRLSYSQLSTYRRCPKQYEYASIKKLPRALSAGESFGSSIHNTLKRWGELEMRSAAPIETRGQLALFTETHVHDVTQELSLPTLLTFFRECFIAEGYESRAEQDRRLQSGEEAMRCFFAWWSKTPRTVVAIEKSFTFPVPDTSDVVLSGRFDRVERTAIGLRVIDFKSTAPQGETHLRTDLQLSLYALACKELWGEIPASLSLLFVTEDGITEQRTDRTDHELKDALTSMRLLWERMDTKDYAATPSVPVCRSCPYRDICPARAI